MITYKEQFDKLTKAYIEMRISPYRQCACFVGNLLNGNDLWNFGRGYSNDNNICIPGEWNTEFFYAAKTAIEIESGEYYTIEEIASLEDMFLHTYQINGGRRDRNADVEIFNEEALFKAFGATLNLLRDIHIAKNEDVDSQFIPEFTKRALQNV